MLEKDTNKLTDLQLRRIQQKLGPYFASLQQLELQMNVVRKAIDDIAGAYLIGLGLPENQNIDLISGVLTPLSAERNGHDS